MSKKQLNRSEVLGTAVNQRRLGPAHRMSPEVSAVEPKVVDPPSEDPCVLASPKVRRFVHSTGGKTFRLQPGQFDPGLHGLSGGWRDFKLNRTQGFFAASR
jgi:hypothetical protein